MTLANYQAAIEQHNLTVDDPSDHVVSSICEQYLEVATWIHSGAVFETEEEARLLRPNWKSSYARGVLVVSLVRQTPKIPSSALGKPNVFCRNDSSTGFYRELCDGARDFV